MIKFQILSLLFYFLFACSTEEIRYDKKTIDEPGFGIIGGSEVRDSNAYPWMASLNYFGGHSCGASFISSRWLITAGHCVLNYQNLQNYTIRYGSPDRSNQEEVEIESIIPHTNYRQRWGKPGFDPSKEDGEPHDIALIKLKRDVQIAQPITIPSSPIDLNTPQVLQAIGYGYTSENSGSSRKLRETYLSIDPARPCVYSHYINKICTQGTDRFSPNSGLRSIAPGDSGGPVFSGNTIIGINSSASWSVGYGVHTNVYSYVGWIRSVTGIGTDQQQPSTGGASGIDISGRYKRENGVQNEWHCVTIAKEGNAFRWTNDAGVSWKLMPEAGSNVFNVDDARIYYNKDIYPDSEFDGDAITGPNEDIYRKTDACNASAGGVQQQSTDNGPNIVDISGRYKRKKGVQNDWHCVTITKEGSAFRWTNDAGVSWKLMPEAGSNVFNVDDARIYYNKDIYPDSEFDGDAITGPNKEKYKKTRSCNP